MMASLSRQLRMVFGLLAASCLTAAYAGSNRNNPNSDWMPMGIDWNQAEHIDLSLLDHSYQPEEVTLKANRPYRITLTNLSSISTHDLNGEDLFHSLVFAKIETQANTVLTPHIHSLLIKPKSTTIIYLVPKIAGEYSLYCSIPGHRDEGMEGLIVIKE